MATMAVLSPITNFSAPATTSWLFSDKISCSVTSRASLKCLQRISGRLGYGSDDVFSSGRALVKQIPVLSNSDFARVEYCTDIEPQSMADESASDLRCTGCSYLQIQAPAMDTPGRLEAFSDVVEMPCQPVEFGSDSIKDADEPSGGVAIAVKILQFYKREISPLLPGSCRFVPTCSEYGMQAFKKYGVVKGAILTAWRLSRCNPLGGSGFDPPRWFDEPRPPPY